MAREVAVVTDSTASLPPELVKRHHITVVPLQVVIGAVCHADGLDADPDTVATALRRWVPVTTSRPAPQSFLDAYEAAADAGAEAVVSVHLSGEVSGTVESARLAAREARLPVEVVDSRHVAMGTGFAVIAAAEAVTSGLCALGAAKAAQERAARTTALFYVDTLEYLRRGGRIGAAAALLGSALAVKPLLQVDDGRIESLEKVRTSARALSRLADLAVSAAGREAVDLAVHHLASPERAASLAEHLRAKVPSAGEIVLSEVGAVIGAHVGPGMVAVVVAPC